MRSTRERLSIAPDTLPELFFCLVVLHGISERVGDARGAQSQALADGFPNQPLEQIGMSSPGRFFSASTGSTKVAP